MITLTLLIVFLFSKLDVFAFGDPNNYDPNIDYVYLADNYSSSLYLQYIFVIIILIFFMYLAGWKGRSIE